MSSTIGIAEQEPDPNSVGYKFVKQYYEALSKEPAKLHRFYDIENSKFSYGDEGEYKKPMIGQVDINAAIMALEMESCKTEIKQVDCQSGPADSILIQVIGWLSKNGSSPMRKFCQTFCLCRGLDTSGNKLRFSIRNDIFRYMLETPTAEDAAEPESSAAASLNGAAVVTASEPAQEPVKATPTPIEAPKKSEEPAPEPVVAPEPIEPPKKEPEPIAAPAKPTTPAEEPAAEPEPEQTADSKKVFSWAEKASKIAPRPTPAPIAAPAKAKPAPAAPAAVPAATPAAVAAAPTPEPSAPAGGSSKYTSDSDGFKTTTSQRAPKTQPKRTSIYVRNIPQDCEVKDLQELFEQYGKIATHPKFGQSINIRTQKEVRPGQSPGRYAFVEFEDIAAFKSCMADADANKPFKVHGRTVHVVERQEQKDRFPGGRRGRGGRGGGRGRGEGRGRGRQAGTPSS